jgi:predicted transposase/invertase (TIGR01784 family)
MSKPFYYASNDAMFKCIFGDGRNTEPLVAFPQSVLDLPPEDYAEVKITNPILDRERPGGKLAILDVRVETASGKLINIEIQLNRVADVRARLIYYWSRLFANQIGEGDDYRNLKRSICILITDFVLIQDSKSYHNRYRLYDPRTGSEFTDQIELHTLELTKLLWGADGTALWYWLMFICARSMEELEMLAEKDPQIARAVAKLVELNADERARMIADSREMLRRDNASRDWELAQAMQAAQVAREEGREEGRETTLLSVARNMLKRGRPVGEIVEATGLQPERIQSLMH